MGQRFARGSRRSGGNYGHILIKKKFIQQGEKFIQQGHSSMFKDAS